MDRFIRRQNVQHYQKLLESTQDEDERTRLRALLAEEQQKQTDAGDGKNQQFQQSQTAEPSITFPRAGTSLGAPNLGTPKRRRTKKPPRGAAFASSILTTI
ncbi:MAG: hypothetical protein ACXWJW_09515 [Xanthobacteraceae bacterium]